MKIYFKNILGSYEPFYKSININESEIKKIEKENPDFLHALTLVHENYHWLQVNSSSIGHLLSSIPVFFSQTVSMTIVSPSFRGSTINVINPLLKIKI